MQTIWISNK